MKIFHPFVLSLIVIFQSQAFYAQPGHTTGADPVLIRNEIHPTQFWCDFWDNNNDDLTPGDTIQARDGSGILCGEAVVIESRGFLMHVYGDDPNSYDVDEGMEEDESVTFFINGQPAILEEGDGTWSDRGSKQVLLKPSTAGIQESYLPDRSSLFQNYPNPFNPVTTITFRVVENDQVLLSVFNMRGERIRQLTSGYFAAGPHQITWNGCDAYHRKVENGIYTAVLNTSSGQSKIKMMVIK